MRSKPEYPRPLRAARKALSSASRSPRTAFVATVTGALLLAGVVYHVQNTTAPPGGAISMEKSLWLCTALFAWFALPALLACDARLPASIRRGYVAFLVLMSARGVIELWMMYVTHGWRPTYGIAHDLSCMVLLAALYAIHRREATDPARIAAVNYLALAVLFVPEISFATYMQANFETRGDHALYFVPDTPEHRTVLRMSAAAVAAFAAYMLYFARRWLRAS